jgi:DNA-binding SARP family transcriptional activator/predicted ATPase
VGTKCYVRLFGGVAVSSNGETITKFQTQKTAALLAYLSCHPHKPFSRDYIAELLWPDGDAVSIRNRLNQAVSSLRRQLEEIGASEVIHSDANSVQVREEMVECDLSTFDRLLKEPAEIFDLEAAVAIYQGDFMEGFPDEWAAAIRIRCWDAYVQALTKLIKHYVEAGDIPSALSFAQQRLAVNVRDERSHRTLMRLYLLAGRPESALAQYRELELILHRDGWLPSARARDLFNEASNALKDEGELIPDELVTVTREMGQISLSRPPRMFNVPQSANAFVGRSSELAALVAAIEGGAKVVALTGLGGIGKSRLAAEFARLHGENWQNRVGWIPIPAQTEAATIDLMMMETARQLAPDSAAGLLILDGVAAISADHFRDFWARFPNYQVLVTERKPVLDPEIVEISVGPLEEAAELLQARLGSAADAEQLDRICRALGGVPLAIELLAVRAKAITPEQFVTELDQLVRSLLAVPVKPSDQASETLSQVFMASIEDLSWVSRKILEQMSVLSAGMTPESLQSLNPEADVLLPLENLVHRGVVIADQLRFQLHPILKELIRSSQTQEELRENDLAVARHFSHYAIRHCFEVHRIVSESSNLERAVELFNQYGYPRRALLVLLSLAYTYSRLDRPGRIAPALLAADARVGSTLGTLMRARMTMAKTQLGILDGVRHSAVDPETYRIFAEQGFDAERALMHIRQVHFEIQMGEWDRALEVADHAISATREASIAIRSRSWTARGHALMAARRDDEAEQAYLEASRVSKSDPMEVESVALSLANLYLKQGRVEEARQQLLIASEAMAMYPVGPEVLTLVLLAEAERQSRSYGLALRYLEDAMQESMPTYRLVDVALITANVLDSMGFGFEALEVIGAARPSGFMDLGHREEETFAAVLNKNLAKPGGDVRFAAGRRRSTKDAAAWGIAFGLSKL